MIESVLKRNMKQRQIFFDKKYLKKTQRKESVAKMGKGNTACSGKRLTELTEEDKENLAKKIMHTLNALYAQQCGVKIEYAEKQEG